MMRRPRLTFQLNPAALGYSLMRDYLPLPTIVFLSLLAYFAISRLFPSLAVPIILLLGVGPLVEPGLALAGWKRTGNMSGVSAGKVVATHSSGDQGGEGMAVVIIGARCNGVWGALDPRSLVIAKQFIGMLDSLAKDPTAGLLNAEAFLSTTSFTRNRLQWILYFESSAHVTRFAHEKLHRGVWKEYYAHGSVLNSEHEVWHEFFSVMGSPDTTYVNSKTHGMAGGYSPVMENGEVVNWKSLRSVKSEQSS